MPIDLDELTYEELIDLNHRVVERLKLLDQMRTHAHMMRFSIGEKVELSPPGQAPVVAVITKYNRKTVNLVCEQGRKWRVSPELLRKIDPGPGAGKTAEVVPIETQRNRKRQLKPPSRKPRRD